MSIRICVTYFPHRYRTTDLRRWRDITIDNVIYALDSTTISTSIKLAAWALEKYSKGAVKMHTLLDLRGSIPANIRITDGKWHDSNELDRLYPEQYVFYVMDKTYVDFKSLLTFHQAKSFWVSRPKGNIRFATIKHMETSNLKSRILEDSHIRLTGYKSSRLYLDNMSFIRVYGPDNDDIIDLTQLQGVPRKFPPRIATDGS